MLSAVLCLSCEEKSNSTQIPSADETIKLTENIANTYMESESDTASHPFLYSGMFQLSKESHYPKYINWLIEKGEANQWQIPQEDSTSVDYSISQFYLSIFQKPHLGRKVLMLPTQNHVRSIIDDSLKTHQWETPKDLYLQPSVLAQLSSIQKKDTTFKYLNLMHENYKQVHSDFWDDTQNLFLENSSNSETEKAKSYSSQQNAAVFAGLALLISELPTDWEHKPFYEDLFKKMAISLKSNSNENGTLPLHLQQSNAEERDFNVAATSFTVFGIAWGVSNDLLDKSSFEPWLLKSWNTLTTKIEDEQGMMNTADDNSAKGFQTGAVLAAGAQMHHFITLFYPIDKATSFTTFMQDGGWCWYQDPRALISNDKLIIAGLSGVSGDARVGVYDLKEQHQDTTLVIAEEIGVDDHNVPALYKRPDNRILAVWAKHAKEKIHYSSLSQSDDYSRWTAIDTFEHKYNKGPGVTYMNLHYIKNQDKLYNFFRDGTNFNPSFITSSDQGETWGNRTHFISNDVEGFQRPYAKYLQVDENTLGISYTDAHPRNYGNSLYYVEFKDNTFYTVEGDVIQSLEKGPLASSSAEKIYAGADTKQKPPINESVPNSAWTTTMAKDKNNHPHIGYTLYLNDDDIRFRIASWDGEQWNDREIAHAGKSLYKIESSYSGLMAFDPEDPTTVFISTDVNPTTGEDLGGNHEIYKATIGPEDDISSIQWEAITSNSPHRNIRPIVVAEDGYKVLVWLYGPWTTFKNYDVNVIGKILEQPNSDTE
jgi:hypothetical protein